MAQNYIVSVVNENEPDKTVYYVGQPKTEGDYPQLTADINKACLMPSGVADFACDQCNSYPGLIAEKHKIAVRVEIID